MKRQNSWNMRKRRAFTLLEVLMVIVILGVLIAAIAPAFMGADKKAKIDTTRLTVESIESTLARYQLDMGSYPDDEEGLAALLMRPDDEDLAAKWGGPYLKKAPRDAWGRDLQYEFPGTYNDPAPDLSSAGPNGEFGDEDDITNWEKT